MGSLAQISELIKSKQKEKEIIDPYFGIFVIGNKGGVRGTCQHKRQMYFFSIFFSVFFSSLLSLRSLISLRFLRQQRRSEPTKDPNPRPCLHHWSSVVVLVFSSSPSPIETTTDRNHNRSKPTTDRNPPARTIAITIQTASPPYGLVIAGSRRIETHHRSNVFSCFVLRLLSSSPPEEGSKSTKDEDCVGPYGVSSVFSQSRRSLLRRFTSSPAEEPTTDDECLGTHQSRDSVFSLLLRQKTERDHHGNRLSRSSSRRRCRLLSSSPSEDRSL